jgi:hypothetical protein
MKATEFNTTLETLVDQPGGLWAVLDELSQICFNKAQHIESAWQDKPLAGQWDRAGNVCLTASGRKSVKTVSKTIAKRIESGHSPGLERTAGGRGRMSGGN